MEANAKQVVELGAIVFPPCECGQPWAKHGTCGGYKPSRPIEDHGTIFFQSLDWLANTLFALEKFIQRLRKARMRKL